MPQGGASVRVTQGHGQGVRRICNRFIRQFEDDLYHMLDLFLLGPSDPYDRLFDLCGCVFHYL